MEETKNPELLANPEQNSQEINPEQTPAPDLASQPDQNQIQSTLDFNQPKEVLVMPEPETNPEIKPEPESQISAKIEQENKADKFKVDNLLDVSSRESQKEIALTEPATEQQKIETTEEKPEEQSASAGNNFVRVISVVVVIAVGIILFNQTKNTGKILGQVDGDDIRIKVEDKNEEGKVNIIEQSPQQVSIDNLANFSQKSKIIAFYHKGADSCSAVFPLEKDSDSKYDSNEINSLRGLLEPLSQNDINSGFLSSIPNNTFIKSLKITNGLAEAKFSGNLGLLTDPCAKSLAKAQITQTLLQFPYIKSVTICVEDNCDF